MNTKKTFLQELDSSVQEELSSVKSYLREKRLEKKIQLIVRSSYEEIFDKIIIFYPNDRIKLSVNRVIADLSITLFSLTNEEQLMLERTEQSDIDFIFSLNKFSKIGYYEG